MPHRRRMRYEVTVHDKDGECISDAIVGPYGLEEELSLLPIHSTMKIVRLTDWEEDKPNG